MREGCLVKYVKMNGSIAVVAVSGPFDVVTSLSVTEDLSSAYNNGCTKVEVNLENTTFIDSAAIGELIKTRRRVGQENFKVKNLKGEVLKVFKGSRLMDWLQ
jgi:anti-anti-sigma factor